MRDARRNIIKIEHTWLEQWCGGNWWGENTSYFVKITVSGSIEKKEWMMKYVVNWSEISEEIYTEILILRHMLSHTMQDRLWFGNLFVTPTGITGANMDWLDIVPLTPGINVTWRNLRRLQQYTSRNGGSSIANVYSYSIALSVFKLKYCPLSFILSFHELFFFRSSKKRDEQKSTVHPSHDRQHFGNSASTARSSHSNLHKFSYHLITTYTTPPSKKMKFIFLICEYI